MDENIEHQIAIAVDRVLSKRLHGYSEFISHRAMEFPPIEEPSFLEGTKSVISKLDIILEIVQKFGQKCACGQEIKDVEDKIDRLLTEVGNLRRLP